ncbi:MAG: glycosyltransferase [Hungatella sp.]|nr:glycosyltransferase [Hungatella sp.]
MELISIIVPCYNEQETLEDYYREISIIRGQLLQMECGLEVLFVDDGSKDQTLKQMKKLAEENPWIKYLSFTRNFGKEAAIYAGLTHACGDWVGLMDVDLQDPPALIPQMLATLREKEYDCVATRRVDRKGEPVIRSFFARAFYKIMRHISDVEIVDGARDFRLMSRQYVDSLLKLKEYNRFSKGLFGWVGYKTKWLEYENIERTKGETKWSFFKLLMYSIDGIVAFSTVPVRFAAWIGLMFCLLAFVFILVIIGRTLAFGDPVAGWPSLVCIILLLSGIQLFCLGLLGEYLSKTYLEVKKRPIYLCRETNLEGASDGKQG